jgi:hypothetical protein
VFLVLKAERGKKCKEEEQRTKNKELKQQKEEGKKNKILLSVIPFASQLCSVS